MATCINVPLTEEARQVVDLCVSLRIEDTQARFLQICLERGLREMIREHVPSVLAARFPENRLMASAFAGAHMQEQLL